MSFERVHFWNVHSIQNLVLFMSRKKNILLCCQKFVYAQFDFENLARISKMQFEKLQMA